MVAPGKVAGDTLTAAQKVQYDHAGNLYRRGTVGRIILTGATVAPAARQYLIDQGLPPQAWEYIINKARARKWNFVFMSESLDGGAVNVWNGFDASKPIRYGRFQIDDFKGKKLRVNAICSCRFSCGA